MMPLQEIADRYSLYLNELTINSRQVISNLTHHADQWKHAAHVLSRLILQRIRDVPPDRKLPIFYLLDSIVKNVGKDYRIHFEPQIVPIFSDTFDVVDERTRGALSQLYETWVQKSAFSSSSLRRVQAKLRNPTLNAYQLVNYTLDHLQRLAPSRRQHHGHVRTSPQHQTFIPPSTTLAGAAVPAYGAPALNDPSALLSLLQSGNVASLAGALGVAAPAPVIVPASPPLPTPTPAPVPSSVGTQIAAILSNPAHVAALSQVGLTPPIVAHLIQVTASSPHLSSAILDAIQQLNLSASSPAASASNSQVIANLLQATSFVPPAATPAPITVAAAAASIFMPKTGLDSQALKAQRDQLDKVLADRAKEKAGPEEEEKKQGEMTAEEERAYKIKRERERFTFSVRKTWESRDLRTRDESLVRSLTDSIKSQCSTCALRFEFSSQLVQHMDWHFSTNKKKKDRAQKTVSRQWFLTAEDWIAGNEESEASKTAVVFGEPFEDGAAEDSTSHSAVCSVPADDSQRFCPICGETFEESWDDDSSEWMFADAISVPVPSQPGKNKIFHAKCYESHQDVAQSLLCEEDDGEGALGKRKRDDEENEDEDESVKKSKIS